MQEHFKFKNFIFSKKRPYLELFPVSIIAITIIYDLVNFSKLPAKIPIHYNIKGMPDNWGAKSAIFFIPCIMIIVYSIMLSINLFILKRKAKPSFYFYCVNAP